MSFEEANKIFESWQNFIETADKMRQVFSVVPESFLPYPVEVLEEALNIISKHCHDSGNTKMVENIREVAALHLTPYFLTSSGKKMEDDEVLVRMKRDLDLLLNNPPLKEATLRLLKETQESWISSRN